MATENHKDVERFFEDGYLVIKNGFPSSIATICQDILWNHLEKDGIMRSDPMTWRRKYSLGNIFTEEDGSPWNEIYSEKIYDKLDLICGKDQYIRNTNCGWWMITFPGFAEEPWDSDGRWHVDGHWYRHYPFSQEIGAILVMFFTDVEPEMGGTAIAVGSHNCISRALAHAGTRGLSHSEISHVVSSCFSHSSYTMLELTGKAGDVILMHPNLIHARSKNLGQGVTAVRFMCHPNVQLTRSMNLHSSNLPNMTPLERSIYQACCEFQPTSDHATQLCTCIYHLQNPLIGDSENTEEASGYPSLLHLLNEITPENCQKIQIRKRNREEENDEDENKVWKRLFHENDDDDSPDEQISRVMGFGNFYSSKKYADIT